MNIKWAAVDTDMGGINRKKNDSSVVQNGIAVSA